MNATDKAVMSKLLRRTIVETDDILDVDDRDDTCDVCPDELRMGAKVEKEHANTIKMIKDSIKDGKITMSDKDIFESIAMDHLSEIPDYYTRLAEMEAAAKGSDDGKSGDEDEVGEAVSKDRGKE